MFNSICSFKANIRDEPNKDNPDMATAFADKRFLFLITLSESMMIIGARLVPMNDDMIRKMTSMKKVTSVLCDSQIKVFKFMRIFPSIMRRHGRH